MNRISSLDVDEYWWSHKTGAQISKFKAVCRNASIEHIVYTHITVKRQKKLISTIN